MILEIPNIKNRTENLQ